MVFKNKKQLENHILTKSHFAVVAVQERIYHILNTFLTEFYHDYDPVAYQRTYQLFRSLVKSDVVRVGNEIKARVYFDLDRIHYITGQKPSGEQVMEAAAQGLHGAVGYNVVTGDTGIGIWDEPVLIIKAEAYDVLKEMLIREGIPIK